MKKLIEHDSDCALHNEPHAPNGYCNCSKKAEQLQADYGRAQLGVDGNHGFALLGPNIQEGEAEFVEIQSGREPDNVLAACKVALGKLRDRLKLPEMNYYFGESHPYGG